MNNQKYIGVQFKDRKSGLYGGRVYTYTSEIPLREGDLVAVETQRGDAIVRVCDPDMPEGKVDERIIPLLKEISRMATPEEVAKDE